MQKEANEENSIYLFRTKTGETFSNDLKPIDRYPFATHLSSSAKSINDCFNDFTSSPYCIEYPASFDLNDFEKNIDEYSKEIPESLKSDWGKIIENLKFNFKIYQSPIHDSQFDIIYLQNQSDDLYEGFRLDIKKITKKRFFFFNKRTVDLKLYIYHKIYLTPK